MKDTIPPNFDEAYVRIVTLVNAVGSIGGPRALVDAIKRPNISSSGRQMPINEEFMKKMNSLLNDVEELKSQNEDLQSQVQRHHRQLHNLPEGSEIVKYNHQGHLPEEVVHFIIDRIKSTALGELHNATTNEITKLKNRLVDFASDAFTRSDLQKMLQLPTGPASDLLEYDNIVTDQNHTKLINLINKSVDLYHQKLEMTKKQYNSLNMGPTSKDLEDIGNASQKYTDAKIRKMVDVIKAEMESINYEHSNKTEKIEEDIGSINDNMNSLLTNQMTLMKQSMDMETRKRESAIIKDLQRRMAAFSTEKVTNITYLLLLLLLTDFILNFWQLVEDISKLQKDLKDKPSANKIHEMLTMIESSFKR